MEKMVWLPVARTTNRKDGPPGNREPSPMSLLTPDQIQDLAVIVLEECGSCLSDDELTDEIALLLEDIAGFETASDEVVRQMINEGMPASPRIGPAV